MTGSATGMLPRSAEASSTQSSDGAINVATWDILGDGVTDHTERLRRVLERVTSSGGASLLFPPGTYRIDGAITIPRNVTIVLPRGALLDNADTLLIEGTLSAGLYRVFLGTGVRFGPGSVQWAFPQWWGALGDGIHDDSVALQAALHTRRVFLPAGKYRTTRELVLSNRATLVGVGNSWSPTATTDSWIQYDGPVEEHVSVLRASTGAVGTQPSSALSSVHVEKIVLNGGNAAGYGLYSAYCTDDSSFVDVTVRHCLQHGVFVTHQWYSSYHNIVARDNPGCGITIGGTFEGWRPPAVNGVMFSNIRAANNGRDGRFDEKSNLRWGYGVLFRPNAGTDIHHVVSENNHGPGLIFDLGSSSANRISGGYLEGNGRGARTAGSASRSWGLVVIGQSNARANTVESVYLHGDVGDAGAQSIWLTGREPTGELILRDLSFGHHLRADWSRYRCEGHVHWGFLNYIEGHIPNSPALVSAGLDTLYVAADGSDTADGRSPDRAFRTLQRAINAARHAIGVRTIECTGVAPDGAVVDFVEFPLNRELTITGNGTACIDSSQDEASALRIRHALNKVTILGFKRIQGMQISACRDVNVSRTTISSRLGESVRIVVDGNSSVTLHDCTTMTGPEGQMPLADQDVQRAPGSRMRVVWGE